MTDAANIGNIRTKKAVIRKERLAKRRALSADERERYSRIICDTFCGSEEYKNAKTILLYKAYNNEVDTDIIFDRAVADGKTVAYPRSGISEGEPELKFYVTNDLSKLSEGFKGILEPDITGDTVLFEGRADICVTPAVAFDKKCHRIGYGKAFYDRYIRLSRPGKVIGLCYDIQITDDFEPEDSDMAVDMVITETAVYLR